MAKAKNTEKNREVSEKEKALELAMKQIKKILVKDL